MIMLLTKTGKFIADNAESGRRFLEAVDESLNLFETTPQIGRPKEIEIANNLHSLSHIHNLRQSGAHGIIFAFAFLLSWLPAFGSIFESGLFIEKILIVFHIYLICRFRLFVL